MRQRLINSWRASERHHEPIDQSPTAVVPQLELDQDDDILPRFATVRHGYDCPAVDEYISDLERELAEAERELGEVKARALAADDVHRELERIGEQTSAVLIAAHDQRDEILRAAREEAERTVTEASHRATALVSQAELQVAELGTQLERTRSEREQLLAEVRRVSSALAELAASPSG